MVMSIYKIKQKQYERFSIVDANSRHKLRLNNYLLVTEKELNELAESRF